MADQTKSVMIGIFVLAAFSIIIFMMLFLHPNIGNEGKILRVRFGDIDKITVGTRVTFAGKPIGEVTEIKEVDPLDDLANDGIEDHRLEHNDVIYVYELTLAIDSGYEIYTTDEITSRTSGLLGEKSVSIMPMPARGGQPLVPVTNQILYSTETGSVESTLKEFKELADKIEIALDGVISALDQLDEDKFWKKMGQIAQNVNEITGALNRPAKLEDIVDNFDATSKSAKEILAGIQNGEGTLGKFLVRDEIYNDISAITNRIQSGEGTIGKFIQSDEFYLRTASLFSKAEVILNDVNHYGILFHQDKGWKRLRARRLNLLEQLSTPQEFRNYFNDELDSITTSIERVSMILQKIDDSCPCGYIFQNPEYIKVYAELLRRVGTLEEYLEMYNQQVVDTEVRTVEFLDNNTNKGCKYGAYSLFSN